MTGRRLGIDHGTKRIGLSVSDPAGRMATPFKTIDARGTLGDQARDVIAACTGFDVAEWVVGLPLNMDGTAGPQVEIVREFGRHLAEAGEAAVQFWDERLSSFQADQHLVQTGLTRKKKKRRRDALAAQVILQDYLDAQRRPEQH